MSIAAGDRPPLRPVEERRDFNWDITVFKVEDKIFQVNQHALAQHSEVFEGMSGISKNRAARSCVNLICHAGGQAHHLGFMALQSHGAAMKNPQSHDVGINPMERHAWHEITMDRVPCPQLPGEGSSVENPIILVGYKAADFEALLTVLYPTMEYVIAGEFPLTKKQWIGVLRISTQLGMEKVRKLAFETLSTFAFTLSPMEKVQLARDYKVATWLIEGLTSITSGDPKLSADELEAAWLTGRTALIRILLRGRDILLHETADVSFIPPIALRRFKPLVQDFLSRTRVVDSVANARAIGADTASATQEQEQGTSGGLTKRSEWRIQAKGVHVAALGLHLLELVFTPPARYPDIFPVLNVLICTPIFVLIWLWSLKCGVEVGWALGGYSSANSSSTSSALLPDPSFNSPVIPEGKEIDGRGFPVNDPIEEGGLGSGAQWGEGAARRRNVGEAGVEVDEGVSVGNSY
ncbi:hypothetical protein NMY22_g9166 [Coprinellus aureogranulatus]|nr:hypothetical protein NMY22_g9166 [Coprinellus aureogranulatus]